jgi:hypothetical protein
LEEKNNPMPQIPGMPAPSPVVEEPKVETPIAVAPKVVMPKEVPPVTINWKKPIIKILIIGAIAIAIFLLFIR